jgi:hypothetical protein
MLHVINVDVAKEGENFVSKGKLVVENGSYEVQPLAGSGVVPWSCWYAS